MENKSNSIHPSATYWIVGGFMAACGLCVVALGQPFGWIIVAIVLARWIVHVRTGR